MLHIKIGFASAALVVAVSSSVVGQAPAAPAVAPSPPTLWSFLGIPQGMKKVRGALTNRRGNTPRTEPKDALKALNDPANLESDVPAIKRAAEIKKAEDLKPQKIKAIKYLVSIGCGCYDKDGSVTDALVAAAEDCTEDVRLVTMKQIHSAARGKCCSNCGQVCCCNDKVLKKLAAIAYERDEFGCYTEPSARVREAAAEALAACCPGSPPLEILTNEPEITPPDPLPVPEGGDEEERAVPEGVTTSFHQAAAPRQPGLIVRFSDEAGTQQASATYRSAQLTLTPQQPPRLQDTATEPARLWDGVPEGIARMRRLVANSPQLATATPNPGGGIVMAFDADNAIVYVHFDEREKVAPIGTIVHLRPDPRVASGFHGTWRVIESAPGCANLEPVAMEGTGRIRAGDQVSFGPPPVLVAPTSFVRR